MSKRGIIWKNVFMGGREKWQIAERAAGAQAHRAQEGILFRKVERMGATNILIPTEGQPLQALRVLQDTKSR